MFFRYIANHGQVFIYDPSYTSATPPTPTSRRNLKTIPLVGTKAYKIIAELKKAQLLVVEGTLYPLLTRLKNNGLLTYNWVESTSGPPRKYYVLSDEGRNVLMQLDKTWEELAFAVKTAIGDRK